MMRRVPRRKMVYLTIPVQNSNLKNCWSSRYRYKSTLTTFNSLLCQKGQFTFHLRTRRWFDRNIFGNHPQNVKIENFSQKNLPAQKEGFQETAFCKRQAGRVLDEFLLHKLE